MGIKISMEEIRFKRNVAEMDRVYSNFSNDNTYRLPSDDKHNLKKQYVKAYLKLLSK